ncbi:MAG: SRPBCC family protein [Parvibaculum sp.]|nr:SRPBCC family protein [Parvibaculum sp.]
MASIRKDILINAAPDTIWSALRDFGALHTRLAVGFVTDTKLEDGGHTRIVTFSNGSVAKEILVNIDDDTRRIAYAIKDSAQITQHSASAQVIDEGQGRSRFIWQADVLPDAVAPYMSEQMDMGSACMKQTLEGRG